MKKKRYILLFILIGLFFNCRVYAYESYKVGDKVTYNGEDYYVIEDSEADKNYVTLLKEKPLTAEEVNKYNGGEYESKDGEMPYYQSKECYYQSEEDKILNGCMNSYDKSNVKKVVDNWSKNLENLVEVDGYKARLIKSDDLSSNLHYDVNGVASTLPSFIQTIETPKWLYDIDYSCWMMDGSDDNNLYAAIIDRIYTRGDWVYTSNKLRPVINLDKCAIENCLKCENGYTYKTEKVKRYNKFKIGDEITYKGEKYYVINNSTSSSYKTLILLKAQPLTSDEINKYKGDLDFISENNTMPYYKSEDCYWNSKDDYNMTDCTNSYNRSYVKQVIDKWSESFDNLIEVGGYKARLLNEDDLYRLGYERKMDGTSNVFCKTEDTPEWVFDNIYWTMFSGEDGSRIYEVTENCLAWTEHYRNELSSVRPVINIDKCAVDGGCYEEEIKVAVGCKDTNTSNNVVNVPNTLKKVSIIIFIICGILVASGIGIIIFNYIKSRKERK